VAIAIALIGVLLTVTGTDYQTYFNGAQFVHFLLGPATVALGVPIYANLALARRNFWPMAAALVVGAIVAIVIRRARRQIALRAAPGPDRACAEVDHGRRGDGGQRGARRRAAVDRRPRDRHRHPRRDRGDAADERARRARLRRGSRRTASAPRGRSRSIRSPASSPASRWGSTSS